MDFAELIRRASEAACKGMAATMNALRPGISELEVLAEAEYAMLRAGSWGSPFRPQVVSGYRALLAHPRASSKLIEEGEIDVGEHKNEILTNYPRDLVKI